MFKPINFQRLKDLYCIKTSFAVHWNYETTVQIPFSYMAHVVHNSTTGNIQTKVYLHYHEEDNAPTFFQAPTKPLSLDLRPLEIVHIDLDGQVL